MAHDIGFRRNGRVLMFLLAFFMLSLRSRILFETEPEGRQLEQIMPVYNLRDLRRASKSYYPALHNRWHTALCREPPVLLQMINEGGGRTLGVNAAHLPSSLAR